MQLSLNTPLQRAGMAVYKNEMSVVEAARQFGVKKRSVYASAATIRRKIKIAGGVTIAPKEDALMSFYSKLSGELQRKIVSSGLRSVLGL